MIRDIIARAAEFPGETAVYCKNLITGEIYSHNPDAPFIAASVIKLWIMGAAFERFSIDAAARDARFVIERHMKMPSCGALAYMRDGTAAFADDLVTLMIILSDNTATNILIDWLGMPAINAFIAKTGGGAALNRRLFDKAAAARGAQNYVSARATGSLLETIYRGELVSPEASREMLGILKNQRLNSKIPFYLDCPVAHKTGEDAGITHDAAIIFSETPYILVFLSNNTVVPDFERYIQSAARDIVIS